MFRWTGQGVDDLYEALRQHLEARGDTSNLEWQLAGRLCSHSPIAFTFNGEIATSDHTIEFLSAHHPIVKAACTAFENVEPPPAAGWLRVEAEDVTPGTYAFYIFRLRLTGARSALELEASRAPPDGTVASDMTDRLIPLITRATAADVDPQGLVDEAFVSRTSAAALKWIDDARTAREADLKRLAGARIDAQLESLNLGFSRRISRIDRRLERERQRQHGADAHRATREPRAPSCPEAEPDRGEAQGGGRIRPRRHCGGRYRGERRARKARLIPSDLQSKGKSSREIGR